jgi:hypothetical protein
MSPHNVSSEQRALVLDQLEGQWQKIAAVLVWKLSKEKRVIIGLKDFAEIARANETGQVIPVAAQVGREKIRRGQRGQESLEGACQ